MHGWLADIEAETWHIKPDEAQGSGDVVVVISRAGISIRRPNKHALP